MITSDDVLTVLKEEAEEDALRLAGVGDEEITDGVLTKTKRRFNWLQIIHCIFSNMVHQHLEQQLSRW